MFRQLFPWEQKSDQFAIFSCARPELFAGACLAPEHHARHPEEKRRDFRLMRGRESYEHETFAGSLLVSIPPRG
jgi:hypothetical protein